MVTEGEVWVGIGVPATELSTAARLLRPTGKDGVTGVGIGTGVGAIAAEAGAGDTATSGIGAGAGTIGTGAGASMGVVSMDGVGARPRLGEAIAGWGVALVPGRNLGGKGNGAGRGAGVATAATLLAIWGAGGL